METFILWVGFLGAWLLFAGPIYQAALELQGEDVELDRIRAARAKVEKPAPTSVWWWIVPPLKVFLERRRSHEYQKRYLKTLEPEDAAALVAFRNKASAWLYVGIGGFFVAAKETYELAHHSEWNICISIAVLLVMLTFSIGHVIFEMKRARRLVQR